MSTRIIISEFLWEDGLAELNHQTQVTYDRTLHGDRTRLRREVATARALIVRNQTVVDEELLRLGPELRVIGRLGVGLDNIDLQAAYDRGIEVVYAPEANAVSVAEYTVGAAIVLCRKLIQAHLHAAAGGWDRSRFRGLELSGKTAGIVGLGRIGELVARRLRAFGLKLLAFDPRIAEGDLSVVENGIRLASWKDLFAQSDLVTLHVPLTPETANLVGRAELAWMKPTAFLINTSRGGVLDEKALHEALAEKRIGGVALDVRRHEPPSPPGAGAAAAGPGAAGPAADPDFGRFDNVLLTPHIAGITQEADVKVTRTVLRDIQRVLRGDAPRFPASGELLTFPRPAKTNGG